MRHGGSTTSADTNDPTTEIGGEGDSTPPLAETQPEEPTISDGPLGELLQDKTSFTLGTKDAVLGLEVRDHHLYVTRFETRRSGINRAASESLFAMPAMYITADGTQDFDWQFVGYMNLRGEETYRQYGYALMFTDPQAQITYELQVTAHLDFNGPFEFTGYLKNETGAEVDVEPSYYFGVMTAGESSPDVWYFNKESGAAEGVAHQGTGQYYEGTGMYTYNLSQRSVTISNNTNQDHNQGGQIPMLYADFGTWGQYYALEWTNGTLVADQGDGDGSCRVRVMLGDRTWARNKFRTTIPAEDALYLPTVYMGIYDGDVDEGSNIFKRWFLYNKAYLDVMSGYGTQTLAEFVAKVRESGMTLTTYILTKDTQLDRAGVPTSVGANGHPEWFSNRCVTGVGQSADFGNESCVLFYQNYLTNFFRDTGVTTWRSDFEPICRESDKANRHDANGRDVQYWCSIGFYDVVDYLYTHVDGFRYESCSSGGTMKDFSTMRRAVVLNCDDSADFLSIKMSFYDSSHCIHPAQLQLPVNAGSYTEGNSRYAGFGDHDFGLRSQMVGAVMLSNWSGTQQADRESWERHLQIYKDRVRPLIKYGYLYHVLPRPDGIHWDGFLYVDADAESSTKGVLMIFKPSEEAGDTTTVKLRGLDPDVIYQIEYQDHTSLNTSMTGAQLMNDGLTVQFTEACTSDWGWIVAGENEN